MAKTYTSFTRIDWLAAMSAVLVWAMIAGWAGLVQAADKSASHLESPTHRQVRIITPKVDGKATKLHTIATNRQGNLIVGLGGKSMSFEQSGNGFEAKMVEEPGIVQMLDSDGKVLEQWNIDMTPSSIGVAPDGSIYVGGDGRIVQLGEEGTIARSMDSPHVGDMEAFQEDIAKAMRKSLSGMSVTYESQIETLKERIGAIEEKAKDDRTRLEEAQLKAFRTQLETFEGMLADDESDDESSMMDQQIKYMVYQATLVTSLAVSDQDVFACASGGGLGGYSVWRIDRDLDSESAVQVKNGLSGCCGQMDIQCCGDKLMISENTRFKVGIYDREGKRVTDFGGRDRTSRAGFGSCCNPMNAMSMPDGTILTAESSIGHIKRFDTEGNLVSYIGKAAIGGGCKHCALGYDEEKDLYYMMYQDKNAICVLANIESNPLSVAESRLLERQVDFLARVSGDWKLAEEKDSKASSDGLLVTLFGGGRGGSSPHPVAALKIGKDGSAKILEGMYKAYGDAAQMELLQNEEESSETTDQVSFALAIDQVRFLEGQWTFRDDDTASLTFKGHQPVTLVRSGATETCESNCAGIECANPNCESESCPQQLASTSVSIARTGDDVVVADAAVAKKRLTTPQEPPRYATYEVEVLEEQHDAASAADSSVTAAAKPTYRYKLLKKKKLGANPEAKLNQMGSQGWEYCGRIGKEMLFKKMEMNETTEAAK